MRRVFIRKNHNNYIYEDSKLNFKIPTNKILNFSPCYKRNFKDKNYETVNWNDEFSLYSDNKELTGQLVGYDLMPKLFNVNEINPNRKYYIKPKIGSNGTGILILSGKEIKNKKLDYKNYLIQQYIKPDLLGGKKYDIRIYYLMVKKGLMMKTYVSLNGKVRICIDDYDKGGELTNSSLIKNKKINFNDYQGTIDNLLEHDRNLIFDLMKKIDKNIKKNIPKLYNIKNFANLYGFDIIKNDQGKFYLLEINGNPNWQMEFDSEELKEIKTKTFDEILKILGNFYNYKNIPLEHWKELKDD